MLDFKVPYFGTQALVFSFLFFFRLSFMADWENESWKAMFKDDFFYAANISAIFYSMNESLLHETILKEFGISNFYQSYHFFSFSFGLILKFFSKVPSYFIFNFFVIPFFQLFAFLGFFSVGLFLGSSKIKCFVISFLVISSLRYSSIDEYLSKIFNIEVFRNSMVFTNYFGFQLLNSGFGLKFCIAIGMISIFFINLYNQKILIKSFFLMFLNPLYILLSGYLFSISLFFDFSNFKKLLLNFFIIVFSFFLFLKTQDQRIIGLDIDDLLRQIHIVLGNGVKKLVLVSSGEIFNSYFFLWIIPFFLILFFEKRFYFRLLAFIFISFPFVDYYFNKFFVFKLFLVLIFGLNLFILFKHYRSKIFCFFYIVIISSVFFSTFSHIYPEFNQVFLFVNFSFPFLFSAFLFYRYSGENIYFLSFYISLILLNVYENYNESKFRSVSLSSGIMNDNISKFTNTFHKDNLSFMGIFNRDMTYQFNNQFWEGEEWFIINDRFIPTPASPLKFGTSYRKNSEHLKELFPISKFSEKYKPKDTTLAFIQKYKIPILVVRNKDLQSATNVISLYKKSITNNGKEYSVFYDLK